MAAVTDAGFCNYRISYCTGDEQADYQYIKNMLTTKKHPDGIIASVERVAIQIYLACHELKIHIPQQLKVLAFSTLETAPILNPSLTTITQPAFEIGRTAADLLFKGIEKNNFNLENNRIVLPSLLIERESTGKGDIEVL